MKLLSLIIILLSFTMADGCLNSTTRKEKHYSHESDYIIIPFWEDSIPIMPSTKFFYVYKLPDFKERAVTIEWVFGNFSHFNIQVDEAWYYEGASEKYFDANSIGKTIVPPSLIVGLSNKSSEILEHFFEPIDHFDPLVRPNGPQSRYAHYVRKIN